ncbi:MAG: hypothetical protein AVDCRST_MAG89-2829 [uncultured Gemmatimonadetes bacterium]|uniref:Uncharacterized protein n=1 Tax=uncultured Gemmatimonadota bacterium TaxID=203437 RepID=A0A6J4LZ26_9BACT|nr:MAG: hypothetical protein AVDCRST_MAG89-2829 [uncultured Gemmatimonadota bacterium]
MGIGDSERPSPGSLQLPPSPINCMGEGTWGLVRVAGVGAAAGSPTPGPFPRKRGRGELRQ